MAKKWTLGLRARIAILVGAVVVFVAAITSSLAIQLFKDDLNRQIASKSDVMQDALRRKGEALAREVALTSSRALVTNNFSFLVEVVNAAVSHDAEMSYGILMSRNRRAFVHSNPALANSTLNDASDIFASQQTEVSSQLILRDGKKYLEVIAPITLEDQLWGFARFGLTFDNVDAAVARSETLAHQQITRTVRLSVLGAVVLSALGVLFGITIAVGLLRPLEGLLSGAHRLREGDMSTPVPVAGTSEFQTLAHAFNAMMDAIRQREADLHETLNQAQEANRIKSEFLANVSHELRTPLNAIINVPSALLKDYPSNLLWHCDACGDDYEPDPDATGDTDNVQENCPQCGRPLRLDMRVVFAGDAAQHRHFLTRTLQSAKHLLAVVTDILDFSKLEAGKMSLYCADTSVTTILEDVKDTVTLLAAKKNIELGWPEVDKHITAWVDPVKLAQILINLVGNAIKFTAESGAVTVAVRPDDTEGWLVFSVRDTGIGIPADKLSSLFESFRQVDGSHTRSHGGTGLGLAICKKLVGLHGGRIWVESDYGHGSTFLFTMPIHQAATAQQTAGSTVHKGRVLIIDDDRTHLELAQHFLVADGYEVVCVDDPQLFRSELAKNSFDIVLLDIMMPNVSGLTLLKEMKREVSTADLPVVVTTAFAADRDIVQSLGALWLPKPWNHEQLVKMVSGHIAKTARRGVASGPEKA